MKETIYTLGYTGFSIEKFIETLKTLKITVVIDVRSSPYSERYSDYNKENLEYILAINKIYYRNYAKEFGARQDNKSFYSDEGCLDFEIFSKTQQFLAGVEKIKNSVSKGYNIVFLCAENDPIQCHRTILVARNFHEQGYNIVHLMPDNVFVSHTEIETRLLDMFFPKRYQLDMFSTNIKTDEEYLIEAYRKQNEKIGYKIEEEE